MAIRCLAAAALFACAAPRAVAPAEHDADPQLGRRVDAFLEPLLRHHLFRGAIVIEQGGRVMVAREVGERDETGAPFTLTTRSRIASITKTFTAAAIELLAQRGRLSPRDTLDKFLPRFPNASAIELRHLLLHRAGLADPSYQRFFDRRVTLDELVDDIGKKPPLFAPGTSNRYSNAGYVVLAKVIEVASKKSYGDFLRSELLEPLALNDTMVDDEDVAIERRARGYLVGPPPSFATRAPAEQAGMYAGSGILLSSAGDLLQWARAFTGGRVVDVGALEYPYGWGKRSYLDDDVVEQSGEITGFVSYLARYRKRDLTIVVLSNLEVGPNDRIGKALGLIAGGVAVDPPRIPEPLAGSAAPTLAGRFAAAPGTFTLEPRDGTETFRWQEARTAEYSWPIGPGVFFVPQDSSTVRLVDAETVERKWGDDPAVIFKSVDGSVR
jgi:CubicO group peptidase (beta-lactamase class C family)